MGKSVIVDFPLKSAPYGNEVGYYQLPVPVEKLARLALEGRPEPMPFKLDTLFKRPRNG